METPHVRFRTRISAAAYKALSKHYNDGRFVADAITTKALDRELLHHFYTAISITHTGQVYGECEVRGIRVVMFEVPGKPWQLGIALHDEGMHIIQGFPGRAA